MPSDLQIIKKSTSFIFLHNHNGMELYPIGTGFFISVQHDLENYFQGYFVTAKHVLQDAKGLYHPEIVLRINTLNGGYNLIKINLINNKLYDHHDNTVDIVLFPCLPDPTIYDIRFISSKLIATKEIIKQQDIEEGDDVVFTGMFAHHIGQRKNQPICRFGKVGLMSDEKIEWRETNKPSQLLDLLLLECQSYGGNSGSPVFFSLKPWSKPSTTDLTHKFFLAGIMKGSFINSSPIQSLSSNNMLLSTQNIGISAVIPAEKLYDILFSSELIELRNNFPPLLNT